MKYNMSEIMKAAWKLVKAMGMSMSKALTAAWAEAKTGRRVIALKDWFFHKMSREAIAYRCFINHENNGLTEKVEVEAQLAETEKAIRVRLATGLVDGSVKGWTTWIPKSCIVG